MTYVPWPAVSGRICGKSNFICVIRLGVTVQKARGWCGSESFSGQDFLGSICGTTKCSALAVANSIH